MEELILVCACKNPNHVIKINYNAHLESAYCDIHLNKVSFKERLKIAVKYLFGKESNFGDYDEFIFNEEHADILIELGQRLKKI